MFDPVPTNISFPKLEEEILAFWQREAIYEQSLAQRADSERFVFYEGPPTANGLPHPGHCLTRAIKDVFPRYRTMRGYRCERKGGWDTHGLPVEVEVCKELGIHSKEEIEAYGIEPFIQKCQQSVWRYMQEWERLTERLGFWVNLDEAYVTYHQSYVESVWWSLKQLFDRGLLYQGHKIVWWWAQGGTALSSGEVGQGYREVADPSVYVKFPLVDEPGTSLLVWTTTPWTLPSNQFAAVHPELEYAIVEDPETQEKLVLAAALVETLAGKVKRELQVISTCTGHDLIGRRYTPPFDYYHQSLGETVGTLQETGESEHIAWRVVAADFVTTDSGSGIVHQAPAFGEVDYEVLLSETARFEASSGPELICAVGPDGKFTAEAPDYEGRWVKACDKDISRDLKGRGLLFHQEQYLHDYPFCWRADQDPLIQFPRRSWFIRTTQYKDQMLANNRQINWLPDHIQEGRFGNFLESNVDWALSRERYWGTPLPIWVCSETGRMEAIDSYDALLAKPGAQGTEVWEAAKQAQPDLPDDLRVHKPYIDEITYDSPFAPGAKMRRGTEVIDCWYDSGAMPFAQWGYPHQGEENFREQFPADFISEAIDQTRGWFYSLLAISTLTFGDSEENVSNALADAVHDFPHPYRNCIVLGLMLSEWYEPKQASPELPNLALTEADAQEIYGQGNYEHKVGKMSKQKRNYREPQEIFDRYGADALRWYFFANQAPWTSIRYSEQAIKDCIPEFLLRLWNVYSFFVIYANIDGFVPTTEDNGSGQLLPDDFASCPTYRPIAERAEIDRWILSELDRTVTAVNERMEAYDNFVACNHLTDFLDALSNWYVRRSRDRYWANDKTSPDKLDAYWTLYECLVTTSKLIAPFTPFIAESLWQNLSGATQQSSLPSVHLCDYPTSDQSRVDQELSARMALLREITSLGRSARMEAKLKVRQPLSGVTVILADDTHQSWLEQQDALIKDELNVKSITYSQQSDQYIDYQVQPNFKRLGPRVGKLMPQVKQALTQADGGQLLNQLNEQGTIQLPVADETLEFDAEDIQVRLQAKPGWAAAQGSQCVVVLATELTDALIREGYARDLVRSIQDRRKQLDCQFTDRIQIGIVTDSTELQAAIAENQAYITTETLAMSLVTTDIPGAESVTTTIGDAEVTLYVAVANDNPPTS